jgi:protein-disulfide isomerase
MALAHIEVAELPGCGAESDCTQAAESRWGKVPGTDWSLSFLGFAYFQSLLAAVIYSGGRLPRMLRAVVAAGTAVSALLIVVMIVGRIFCGYCLAIHLLNISFAAGYELSERISSDRLIGATRERSINLVFVVTFIATSLLLVWVQQVSSSTAKRIAQQQLEKALRQAAKSDPSAKPAFAPGRYYLGPESALVHVTIVSDYQCPSCRTIDAQLRSLTAGRSDVSISARHFPFCTDCNAHIDKTRHPNACRAALAAEAAGQIGGATAFWQMHDWLFERRGEFTEDELQRFVQGLRLDAIAFLAAMKKDETLAVIRADAAAADAAGLRFTPMIFINGKAVSVGKVWTSRSEVQFNKAHNWTRMRTPGNALTAAGSSAKNPLARRNASRAD